MQNVEMRQNEDYISIQHYTRTLLTGLSKDYLIFLIRGQQIFSIKAKTLNILDFSHYMVLVTTTQLFYIKGTIDNA